MALEITKSFTVRAPIGAVWDFLTDPQRVARCLPGAAITGKLDENTYGGTMTVKVGPVATSYKGKLKFENLDASARRAEIVASGQDVRGRGGADLRLTSTLEESEPGRTAVTAVSVVSITGILAQMGRGMIQDVSDQMFQVFSERMRSELESSAAGAGPARAPSPAVAGSGPSAPPVAAPSSLSSTPLAVAPSTVARSEEALDLGSLGSKAVGRAAGRAVRRPALWIVIGIAVAIYLLTR
jgi:carbon monoxide dehydrogenase subunit G